MNKIAFMEQNRHLEYLIILVKRVRGLVGQRHTLSISLPLHPNVHRCTFI